MDNKRDIGGKLVFFGNGVSEYEIEDMLRSFAEAMDKGKGTFGTTYKTMVELKGKKNKLTVAVKRLTSVGRLLPEMEFSGRIEKIGKFVHENLCSIRAYYYSRDEILLVCDYMPMGSLASFLHGKEVTKKSSLTWEVRTSIAFGVARGITYIHTQGSNVCHGNLRSSNVLLTDTFDARVSDFCIPQLVQENAKLGYRAPEVTSILEVTQKSDVYSFGVLLLELLTGEAPLDGGAVGGTQGQNLCEMVRVMFQEKPILDVFDEILILECDKKGEQMVQLLELAICCTFKNPSKRPSMAAVSNRIKHICRFH